MTCKRGGTAQQLSRNCRIVLRETHRLDQWRLLRFEAGNQQDLLDSQKKARKYKGKDVKITGTLERAKNLIHVEKIAASPSM
jgi:hypothetical protein